MQTTYSNLPTLGQESVSDSEARSSASPLTLKNAQEIAAHLKQQHGIAATDQSEDAILATLKASLADENVSDWRRAKLFYLATVQLKKSYTFLADMATKWGYRKYTRQHTWAIVTTAEFFNGVAIDESKPFTFYAEVVRAMRSLKKKCDKLKVPHTANPTPADVLKAVKGKNTRPEIAEELRKSFAAELPPTPLPKRTATIGTYTDAMPLYQMDLGIMDDLKGASLLVAAPDEEKARELLGAKVVQKSLDAELRKRWKVKGTAKLPYTTTTFTQVGNIVVSKPTVLALIPLTRDEATTAHVAALAEPSEPKEPITEE